LEGSQDNDEDEQPVVGRRKHLQLTRQRARTGSARIALADCRKQGYKSCGGKQRGLIRQNELSLAHLLDLAPVVRPKQIDPTEEQRSCDQSQREQDVFNGLLGLAQERGVPLASPTF
jgi:hypothetical protein